MRDHQFFEKFAESKKMRPVGYVDTPQGRVLLADSERAIAENGRIFYRTGYAVQRSGLDFGNFAEYELHETGGSKSQQQERLNQALVSARTFIAQLDESGYFDDGRKGDFSTRPSN